MFTGAVVLVIEILGAKMLTPWFGSSHFVWTAQITVTLLALAAGYYLGGWAVDRYGRLSLIYGGMVVAAAYLGLTVRMRSGLASSCLAFDLALGSIVASLLLFFVPLTLLAAVGPFFVRFLTSSMSGVGRTVGRLSALGTVGSVVGVLVTSHVLVPFFRDSVSLLGTAAVLVVLAAVHFLSWGIDDGGKGLLAGGAVVGAFLGVAGLRTGHELGIQDYVQRARANSHFGNLQVIETKEGRRRYYLNDLLVQNTYDPVEKKSLSMFTYALYQLSRSYTPRIGRVLCLGMGVGIAPRRMAADGVPVDVVEINPAIVPVAQEWFDFDPGAVRLVIDDARHFLRVTTNRYDNVQLDAFLGDSSPSHLMTREAFEEIHRVLEPGGTLVINSFAHFDSGRDFFGMALHRTLGVVFKQVLVHVAPGGNVFFVASDREPLTFTPPATWDDVHPACVRELQTALARTFPVDSAKGLVLTDDYNPVDYYDAGNRERNRRYLAEAFTRDTPRQ